MFILSHLTLKKNIYDNTGSTVLKIFQRFFRDKYSSLILLASVNVHRHPPKSSRDLSTLYTSHHLFRSTLESVTTNHKRFPADIGSIPTKESAHSAHSIVNALFVIAGARRHVGYFGQCKFYVSPPISFPGTTPSPRRRLFILRFSQ